MKQRTLLPGFIDNHIHPLFGALSEYGDVAQLGECENKEQLLAALGKYAAGHPESAVIGLGAPYFELTRQDLDTVATNRTVAFAAYDLHAMWGNTWALERAGLLHPTAAQQEFVPVAADGTAVGIMKEAKGYAPMAPQLGVITAVLGHRILPMSVDDPNVPNLSDPVLRPQLRALLARGLETCAKEGITTLHVMDGDRQLLRFFDELAAEGALPVRVVMGFSVLPRDAGELDRVLITDRVGAPGDLVRCDLAKFWMDGVYESRTAVTLEPYPGTTNNTGEPLWAVADYEAALRRVRDSGLRAATHTVGDGAVHIALSAYAKVLGEKNGTGKGNDRRWQVEHIETISDADVPVLARHGIIAGMQPLHAYADDAWLASVPPASLPNAFAWEKLRAANATLVWGSDWPVAPPTVLEGIRFLVRDRPAIGGQADQRQTAAQAVRGYTAAGAYAEFAEHDKGTVARGMLADLVLLSTGGDITAQGVHPVLTICNGAVTYSDNDL